jgi:2-oxoglutarate dehydrogenase E1 component
MSSCEFTEGFWEFIFGQPLGRKPILSFDYYHHMNIWHDFHGPNAGYILELYERYQHNPDSVDPATRAYFKEWTPPVDGEAIGPAIDRLDNVVATVRLAQAIREYGHLAAQLDPLGSEPPGDPSLDPAFHGITEEDLRRLPASLIGGPIAEKTGNAQEAIQALRQVYSTSTGYDYDHLRIPAEREWLRHAAEAGLFRPPPNPSAE